MWLAKHRKSPPKDLGIDLLILKEKKVKREKFDKQGFKDAKVIEAIKNRCYKRDSKGFFKIFVDEKIKAVYFRKNKPSIIIEGKSAKDISDTILRLGLISTVSHASYLGRELKKAEFALKYGRSYIQD
jgi:dihydropteroate synthase